MSTTPTGKIITALLKGEWSGATRYTIADIVRYNGSSYVCIRNHTNHIPPNDLYWVLFAERGTNGSNGINGEVTLAGVQQLTNKDYHNPALTGNVTGDGIDTDVSLAGNSDVKVPSQKAVKTYVDSNSVGQSQKIINGNFDIWQRNTTKANPVHTEFVADRWKVLFSNSGTLPTTITHSRQIITPGDLLNSFYHYRVAPNSAGSGFGGGNYYTLLQAIEHGTRFFAGAGKKITISFWAKSNIAGKKLGIGIEQGYGTGGSPTANEPLTGSTVTLTSTWTKYTLTVNLNTLVGKTFGTDNNDTINLYLFEMWGATIGATFGLGAAETFVGAGNIDFTQVLVTAGAVTQPFQPKSFNEELFACQRYFAKSYDYGNPPGASVSAGVIQGVGINSLGRPILDYRFPRKMRIVPTMTFYSTTGSSGTLRDATAGGDIGVTSLYLGDTGGCVYDSASTVALGNHVIGHWTADAEL